MVNSYVIYDWVNLEKNDCFLIWEKLEAYIFISKIASNISLSNHHILALRSFLNSINSSTQSL